ncbi:hypothetical protein B4135_2026 [Caldibacillus debilis]|uniref:Uncharacterized protein n=1 Tax=Caldibacillus debilis TaxID=301148 RepID=A0A150M6K0_9BACI|nr:hypothetical protein B4135_2026 [Caldibacillus debilis]
MGRSGEGRRSGFRMPEKETGRPHKKRAVVKQPLFFIM